MATIGGIVTGWTDAVAVAGVTALGWVVAPRVVRLIEQDDGGFTIAPRARGDMPARVTFAEGVSAPPAFAAAAKGSRIEIVLQPRRFLFKPFELPARAADFLESIVRAQIDRLTPWDANEAVFGCSAPVRQGEGIVTIVAATTRKAMQGLLDAVARLHPRAIAVAVEGGEHQTAPIWIMEQQARGRLDPVRFSRALRGVLAVLVVGAVAASIASTYVVGSLEAREAELARQIGQRRATIRAGAEGGDGSPTAALERRKHETPSSVVVLEALSRVLPDHTYVTEMHIAGNRLQFAGLTRDAPSLIPLVEQGGLFTRATFYAPTTRSPNDPGERFHIEARIETRGRTR